MSDALYLIARIAGRGVAFDSRRVDSVVDLGPVVPVPLAAPGIVGLAALRSRVVAVVDPRIVLGLAADARITRAVVTRIDGHPYAILVETLEDVATYATIPVPAGVALTGAWAGVGGMLLDQPGEPVLVVEPARLIPNGQALAA